jgi:glycosyltransferase involved in cell wall biosynthesis
MAERVISLLKDPERAQRMGQVGRRFVEAKFSCEAQLQNTTNLYDRLLGKFQVENVTRNSKATSQEATVIER